MLVMQLEIFETKHALCYVMLFIDDDGIVKWRYCKVAVSVLF